MRGARDTLLLLAIAVGFGVSTRLGLLAVAPPENVSYLWPPSASIRASSSRSSSVTDVVLPGRSGRALVNDLRATKPTLRVLYTSGYPDDLIAHHGVLDPGVSFLQKPCLPAELEAKVVQALDEAG